MVKWHEGRLSTDSTSESDMLDVEPDEPAKRLKVRGYAWSFERECECDQLFHDARQMASDCMYEPREGPKKQQNTFVLFLNRV